jgi:hypothetical protein
VTEPPTAATLIALMLGLRTGSALAGADAWADPTADAAGYALLTSNMTTLCRFVALQKEKAARRELTYVGAAGAPDDAALRSREEEEKKNHKAKAAELALTASAMYNTDFLELCDSAVLVATHHEFQRNRLVTARCTTRSITTLATTSPSMRLGAIGIGPTSRHVGTWCTTRTLGERWVGERRECARARSAATPSCPFGRGGPCGLWGSLCV